MSCEIHLLIKGRELVSLDGQTTEDKHSLSLLEEKVKQQYSDYVKEELIVKTKPFNTPIVNLFVY